MSEILGLREAVADEIAARERKTSVETKLEDARNKVADATTRRQVAIENAAAGQAVNLSKIEKDLVEANQLVRVFEEALTIAEKAADRAEGAVAAVLRRVLREREAEARAEYSEIEASFLDLAGRRIVASQKLASATGTLTHIDNDNLFVMFSSQIDAVS